MSCHGFHLRVFWRLNEVNRFKPSSKIFYWPFQGGTSFVDLLLCLLCLCVHLFICALWSPAGKGLTSWLSFLLSVSLSLSNWYPGSGVALECVDSWSLRPYLHSLCFSMALQIFLPVKLPLVNEHVPGEDPGFKERGEGSYVYLEEWGIRCQIAYFVSFFFKYPMKMK